AEAAGTPRLGNGNGGVSGPVLLPVGVLAVARVVERAGGLPVIGVGGVRSAADVRQYLAVGASLVAIGTAALADPRLVERIVRDLERGHEWGDRRPGPARGIRGDQAAGPAGRSSVGEGRLHSHDPRGSGADPGPGRAGAQG